MASGSRSVGSNYLCGGFVDRPPPDLAKLYRRGRYFGCRVCHDLTYRSSQQAHRAERNERMLSKIIVKHRMNLHRLVSGASSLSSDELFYLVRTLD